MPNIHQIPVGSAELKLILADIAAGKPIDRPGPGKDETALHSYFSFLSNRNSIFSIVQHDKRYKHTEIGPPQRLRGIFMFTTDPSKLSLKLYMRYVTKIVGPDADGVDDPGERKGGEGFRPGTTAEAEQAMKREINRAAENVKQLKEFVATAWKTGPENPAHPLWRPAVVHHSVDPFDYPFPGANNSNDELDGHAKAVLYSRQIVALEMLYHEMETIMAFVFGVGRAADKGALFSDEGKDIFAANEGLIKDFVFLHRLYMNQTLQQMGKVEIVNLAAMKKDILERDYSSMLNALSGMGI